MTRNRKEQTGMPGQLGLGNREHRGDGDPPGVEEMGNLLPRVGLGFGDVLIDYRLLW